MFGLSCSLVFLSVIQCVLLQGPPAGPLCGPPPVEKPFECCKMPHLFTDDDRAACGFEEPTEGKRKSPPDCKQQLCIMKKKNLMKDDETVDLDAVSEFLDKYTAENSDFKEAVDKAKARCLKEDTLAPPGMCPPGRIIACMFFETFNNCPKWEESEKCEKLKKHMQECRAKFA